MTSRIYYTDPSCVMFEAIVTRTLVHDDRPAAVLDRTAFYPTSGGQPFDTGRLGSVDVVDVVDTGDEVIHILRAPLAAGAQACKETYELFYECVVAAKASGYGAANVKCR
jgi:Ser-tRNA(Ala) deacylase AlaX